MKEYIYTDESGKEAVLTHMLNSRNGGFYTVRFEDHELKCCKTEDEAKQLLSDRGYSEKGFKDEQGVTRHALSRGKIEFLYTQLENFIADCTVEEYNEYKESFTAVKTLIHQRIRETLKK